MSDVTGVVNGRPRIDEGEMLGLRGIGRLRRHLPRRRRDGSFAARVGSDDGFTIIETALALGLVFTVMLGLLASLSTGIRGLSTGRQRNGAVAIAKEMVERARGSNYAKVGHDLSDPDLAADPEVTLDAGGSLVYTPDTATGPELLVGATSAVFAPHELKMTRDNIPYTVRVYVTEVPNALGADHKRLTVDVRWERAQYDPEAVPPEVKVSTFLSEFASVPPAGGYAYGEGVVDADSGLITITGTLGDLSQGEIFLPVAHADADSDLVIQTRGLAESARSVLALNSTVPAGCEVTGNQASCDGFKVETAADNNGLTPLPLQHVAGPSGDPGGTVTDGGELSLFTGATGSVVSRSSAESCVGAGCVDGSVGDGDGLAYAENSGAGPASVLAGFSVGVVSGDLVESDAAGSASATIDQDAVAGGSRFDSVGNLTVPAMDLVALDAGPLGFASAVSVSAFSVTGTAQAGPTASSPVITGDPVTVSMYETGPLGGAYTDVTFIPGKDAVDASAIANFGVTVLGVTNTVTLETTVTTGSESTTTKTDGSTIIESRADLTNWFIVRVHLVVQDPLGSTLADVEIELDYGRLSAFAEVRS